MRETPLNRRDASPPTHFRSIAMSADFNNKPSFTPAGVTTAAVLVVILAMGLSTLLPSETQQPGASASSSSAQLAQAHHQKPVKKS
jgi:hypothetical protein